MAKLFHLLLLAIICVSASANPTSETKPSLRQAASVVSPFTELPGALAQSKPSALQRPSATESASTSYPLFLDHIAMEQQIATVSDRLERLVASFSQLITGRDAVLGWLKPERDSDSDADDEDA